MKLRQLGRLNHNLPVPVRPRPAQSERTAPRAVAELRRLREEHPELAPAIDLQIPLIELQRRLMSRTPLPLHLVDSERARRMGATGRPLLQFDDLTFDWSDFRLSLRETAELLRRFDAMEEADCRHLQAISRDGHCLEPLVRQWYDATSGAAPDPAPSEEPEWVRFAQAFTLALRPFLASCAVGLLPRLSLSDWQRGVCPLCGAEPDFCVITAAGQRELVCSRCTGRWPYDAVGCPFCANDDRLRLTSFAGRGSHYRLNACDVCLRYLKAYDERSAERPLILAVDTIASLPLDAAALQKGYLG
jgi:FdhE protein